LIWTQRGTRLVRLHARTGVDPEMDQYFVERDRSVWKIRYDGSYVGIFPTKETAISWAIERAHNAVARGGRACVFSQADDETLRTEWASEAN